MEKILKNNNQSKTITVMPLQFSSQIANREENYKTVEKLIASNYTPDVDIIILPEVWTVGWDCSHFQDEEDTETLPFLQELAKKYNCWILGGSYIRKEEEKYYNTCPVINRNGKCIAMYNKMHLFSYYGCNESDYIQNGTSPVMVDIEDVKIGLTICYDIRFPEIYRAYRQAGADLLVNMAAWPLSRALHWESLTRARAIENQTYMIALTQSGQLSDGSMNLGHSRILSYDGTTLVEITGNENVTKAKLDFEPMYEFRNKCTILKDIHDKYEVIYR